MVKRCGLYLAFPQFLEHLFYDSTHDVSALFLYSSYLVTREQKNLVSRVFATVDIPDQG
jgi:hypothetical protein